MDYVSNAKDTIQNSVPAANEITDNITNAVSNARNTIGSTIDEFSSKAAVGASTEFLDANGLVAKFAFLVLIIAFFLFLLNLGISVVSYFINPSKSPYIFPPGMVDGNADLTIAQDPSDKRSAIVYRSSNRSSGIEFTWSCWLNINKFPTVTTNYSHIFNKGTGKYGTRNNKVGIDLVNDGPGLYVKSTAMTDSSSNKLELYFIMNTISPNGSNQISDVSLNIPNFPVNKWCHVCFRLKNKVLDCYVNGVIQGRTDFGDKIPKQNYDPIHIGKGQNSGFNGKISNLRYYDYALSVFEINSIVYYGPNTKTSSATGLVSNYGYLANSWYSNLFN